MPELRLAQLALRNLAEGKLNGRVTVTLGFADRGHRAGSGFDHRYRDDGAVLGEDLGHAELSSDDRGHG